MSHLILPGAMVGVFGGGQLGRMFAVAARQLGYRVAVFDPDPHAPAKPLADLAVTADYEDSDAVTSFAKSANALTVEFEHIPAAALETAAHWAPLCPGAETVRIAQHRTLEKNFLAQNGFPVAPYAAVDSLAQLPCAVEQLGCPAILKSAENGYDGKNQWSIHEPVDVEQIGRQWAGSAAILERRIEFLYEISVIVVRSADGSTAHYGPIRNTHAGGILDVSTYPAGCTERVAQKAVDMAMAIAQSLNVIGILCVEMFVIGSGESGEEVLVNEIAPRPHNSGHLTIEAHVTSQFEQQLRAMCGLPVGSSASLGPAAMANLLGDLWLSGEPDWPAALAMDDVHLHLYGKLEARMGRKMGHITALGESAPMAACLAAQARHAAFPQFFAGDSSANGFQDSESESCQRRKNFVDAASRRI